MLELPNGTGKRLFELQSLIVLCVAESLRSNHVATAVGQTIRASTTGLLGAPTRLPTFELLRTARAWGQTSDAIFRTLSPQAQEITLESRGTLSAAQRQFSDRIDLAKIDPAVREFATHIKVLKRPGDWPVHANPPASLHPSRAFLHQGWPECSLPALHQCRTTAWSIIRPVSCASRRPPLSTRSFRPATDHGCFLIQLFSKLRGRVRLRPLTSARFAGG